MGRARPARRRRRGRPRPAGGPCGGRGGDPGRHAADPRPGRFQDPHALQRERLHDQILAKALCCSIAQASVEEIDTHNILQATMLAMRRAVEGLRLKPAKVLVDGNRLPTLDVLAEAVVKGDALVKAISAASILAKVHRDRLCEQLHVEFPHYGFAGHKGYGTPEHLEALQRHGACVHHRRSFSPVAAALARTAAGEMLVIETLSACPMVMAATVETVHLDLRAAP
jgi:ribonuclease HII